MRAHTHRNVAGILPGDVHHPVVKHSRLFPVISKMTVKSTFLCSRMNKIPFSFHPFIVNGLLWFDQLTKVARQEAVWILLRSCQPAADCMFFFFLFFLGRNPSHSSSGNQHRSERLCGFLNEMCLVPSGFKHVQDDFKCELPS